MRDENLVSVIVPSYNGARYLGETIESIMRQSYEKIELILVDDGSTDGTRDIMKDFEKKDTRVKVLHQENSGVSAARENGYQNAGGGYILFADDDDIVSPFMVEDMLKQLKKHPEADYAMACMRHFDDCESVSDYQWGKNVGIDTVGEPELVSGHEVVLRCTEDAAKSIAQCSLLWGTLYKYELLHGLEGTWTEAKNKLTMVFFEDVFLRARIDGAARQIVLMNRVYCLKRSHDDSIGSTLKASEYSNQRMYGAESTYLYYKALGWDDLCENQLIAFYLTIEKQWYILYQNEKDEEKKHFWMGEIRRLFDLYKEDLMSVEHKGVEYYSILLWDKHPRLWYYLVKVTKGW